MTSENVAKAAVQEVPFHRLAATAASATTGPPGTGAQASSWKPALPEAPPAPIPGITAQQADATIGRWETAASSSDAAQPCYIALPGCGRPELARMSMKATNVLRHRAVAKSYLDGMVSMDVFCESFERGRSPSSCLTLMVFGSNKVRFQIRATRSVDVSFFQNLQYYGQN